MLRLLYTQLHAKQQSLVDGKQPTVFDNDIDMGTKPTEDILFHRFKYFFRLSVTGGAPQIAELSCVGLMTYRSGKKLRCKRNKQKKRKGKIFNHCK